MQAPSWELLVHDNPTSSTAGTAHRRLLVPRPILVGQVLAQHGLLERCSWNTCWA